MGKLIAFEWTTLDGVYDAESMPAWWEPYDSPDRQRCIQDVYGHTDAFLLGRATYEMLGPYWSTLGDDEMGGVAGNLNNTPKYVVTTHQLDPSWKNSIVLNVDGEPVDPAIDRIKKEKRQTVLVGSSELAASLMKKGLIDEYLFLMQPAIAGEGKRFFREGMTSALRLRDSQALDKGVTFLRFEPA